MGRRGEKELIFALHAIDTEFLARTVIRADKGPIDFVILDILEFFGEIGRKSDPKRQRAGGKGACPGGGVGGVAQRGRDGDRGDSGEVVAASSSAGPVSMEQAQFDVEITEATPKRSELEEMPESRNVRKIDGLAVCSIDIVGAAQADYDDPRSSGDELERKAAKKSDAVHTHEGEPMNSFEVPIPERDIVGVKSGVVLDPAKVQVARQKEIDSIARHEIAELVTTSECTQGTLREGRLGRGQQG